MKLKFPSIRDLTTATIGTLARFPLVFALLFAGFFLSIYLTFESVSLDSIEDRSPQFLLSLFLTLLLLIPSRLAIENGSVTAKWARFLEPFALIPGIALFWSLPMNGETMSLLHATRIGMITLSAAFVLFLFAKNTIDSDDDLWNWHGVLVPSLARGFLYSMIILIGITAAFGAIDYLFGMHLLRDSYLRILIFLFWSVGPILSLHTIPRGGKGVDSIESSSLLLQIPRFILFPLTILYLVILYAYGIQIAATSELPKGMIAHLVLGFAGFGLFSFWTMVPLLRDSKYRWLERARIGFFVLQLPLVALLFMGISRRISDYGWTFQRYLIVELAVWLLIASLSVVILRRVNFRAFFASLAVVSLITVIGPINAYTVTVKSQGERLESILKQGGMISEGKLCKATGTLNDSLTSEAGSIIRYLDDYGLFENLNSLNPDSGTLTESKISEITGVSFPYNRYGPATNTTYFNYYPQSHSRCDTLPDGTRILSVSWNGEREVKIEDSLLKKYLLNKDGSITLIDSAGNSLFIPLKNYARILKAKGEKERNMSWIEQNDNLRATVLVTSLSGNFVSEDSTQLSYGTATILLNSVK